MAKFFLKKIDGVDDLVKVVNKPIWGKIPDFYRDVDWNIDNNWYRSNGTDLLLSTDPFGDQSLLRKFMFDGTYVDKVSGTVTAVPGGTHNHFQKSGPFDTKCLTIEDAENGTNQINCGAIDRSNVQSGFTISGWVKLVDDSTLVNKRLNQTANTNWMQIWHVQDNVNTAYRSPALFYSANLGQFAGSVVDSSFTFTNGSGDALIPNILGEWIHITQIIQKFSSKLYINGVLFGEYYSTSTDNALGNATLFLGHNFHGTNASYKQVEVYKRDLSPTEVKALYNQQLFNEVICDGSNPTYKPFTYLTEKEKLLRVVTDESGNIVKYELVKKPGYIASTDNVVKYENGQLLDRYGKNVLSGSLNRLMHFSSNTLVGVTANATWGVALTADIELNTDKYDYIFMYNTGLHVNSTLAMVTNGGADINISIGNTPIVTNGHRGHTTIGSTAVIVDIYSQVDTISPLITQGYKGKFKVRCSLARYSQDTSSVIIRNHNNAGAYSGKLTSTNLSTLTVYELNKASNDLV